MGAGEGLIVRRWDQYKRTANAALPSGEIHQLADGRAAVHSGLTAAASGERVTFDASGQYTCPKTTGIVLLDGGRAYWDYANRKVHFKKTGTNARDFYLGRIVGDAASADTSCVVNINDITPPDIDLARDTFTSVAVLTAGAPSITRYGGAHLLLLDATNEAEKIDALTADGFATGAKAIIRARINITADDSSTHAIFSLGAASGTHATAVTSITNAIFVQAKAHDGKIYAGSQTSGTTVNPTDTTKTYTAGTAFEVWFDLRNPAAPAIYIDGVQVLSSTVFDVSASAVAWFLLAHLVKTATTDTMQVRVDWLDARFADQ